MKFTLTKAIMTMLVASLVWTSLALHSQSQWIERQQRLIALQFRTNKQLETNNKLWKEAYYDKAKHN